MDNSELIYKIQKKRVYYWEIAQVLDISQNHFSRILREKLSKEAQNLILRAADAVLDENENEKDSIRKEWRNIHIKPRIICGVNPFIIAEQLYDFYELIETQSKYEKMHYYSLINYAISILKQISRGKED